MKNKFLKAGAILAVLAIAVLAMAGAGAAETVSDLAGLKTALDNQGVTEITLGADITLGTEGTTILNTLEVGRDLTLDLNGHTLKGSGDNQVISVKAGILTMKDSGSGGLLTNGYVTGDGYGVVVTDGGKFVMNSGTIGDCSAGYDGAGVINYGTFEMNGGTIENCVAGYEGGGVINRGTFEMNGGTIKNCSSLYYGGVVNYGTFTMNNGATITYCSGHYAGGVFVCKNSKFSMKKGTISYCCGSTEGKTYGSGVSVDEGGEFYMDGGIIEHCDCTSKEYGYGIGGGVYINNGGKFILLGGTISECTAKRGGGVYIDNGGTFSQKYGTISNCDALIGGGVYINGGGSFTLDEYEISGCTAYYGGGVYVGDDASFTMNGGEISGNTSDNLYIADSGDASYSAEIEVVSAASAAANVFTEEIPNPVGDEVSKNSGGKVVINGGTIDGKVINNGDMEIGGDAVIDEIYLPEGKKITILDTITDGAKIGIKLENPEDTPFTKFSPGYIRYIVCKNNGKYFDSETGTLKDGHGHYGVVFTEWTSDNSLPSSGNYYLTKDVTLADTWTPTGDVNLCLNGYVVKMADGIEKPVIFIGEGITFKLHDCCDDADHRHYFTVDDSGLWKLTGDETNYYVNGGVITGGKTIIGDPVTSGMGGGVYCYTGSKFVMTGGNIAGNTADIAGGGVYCDTGSKFVMSGGKIAGNTSTVNGISCGVGGGICSMGGSFTMYGGSIMNNTARTCGGGVFSDSSATTTMNGGRIAGNSAEIGGGVYIYNGGTFAMTGGIITGNTAAYYGGGVYTADTITVGKSARITGNKVENAENNVYLLYNKTITINPETGLTSGARIGVTTDTKPTENSWVQITDESYTDYSLIFTSDNDSFMSKDMSIGNYHAVALVKPETVSVTGNTADNFGDMSSVDKIVFTEAPGDDTVITYVEGLSADQKPSGNYTVLGGFEISVNKEITSGATITFATISTNPENVCLMHQKTDETWEFLATGYDSESYKYSAVTTSFSPFAIVELEPEKIRASSVTSFSGTKDGSDFTFDKAVVITKATLPGATSATVTNTSGSGWYTGNLSTDGFSGNGVLYFQVPLDVIDIKGYTVNDVSLIGCKTTYLGTEGKYAKYSAVITKDGALTIDFEEDAATAAVEKVQEVVEQKQTATEQKQEVAEKVQETVEQKQTEVEQKQTAAKTPFPVLGILAGLGIAGILVMRRH